MYLFCWSTWIGSLSKVRLDTSWRLRLKDAYSIEKSIKYGAREGTTIAITVVDAPCGAGKTEWAISYMNAHQQEAFIFVTPFLSEVERIKKGTTMAFYDPQHYHRTDLLGGVAGSKTKLEDFNDLLAGGRNIVTTHTTFTNATQETISILQDNSYHLILDEAVDVLLPLNDLIDSANYRVNKRNVQLMLDNNIIAVDENCRVRWTGGPQPIDGEERHSFCEVQRHAQNGNLLLIDGKFFLWEFSPDVFNAMESVTILTYQLEGSFLCPYMQLHGMEYGKSSVSGSFGTGFDLSPYAVDMEQRERWKKLITMYRDEKITNVGSLSATWYKNCVKDHSKSSEASALRRALRRFFLSLKAKPCDIMWSCPKDSRSSIAPGGYKLIRELTDEEKQGRTQVQQDEYIDSNGLRCWVASNARATNGYSDRHVLAYMLNLNPNPEIAKYFGKQGGTLSRDTFALAGLIQWVWRSAIRKGEPITLFLPSPRMQKLFTEWLDGKR